MKNATEKYYTFRVEQRAIDNTWKLSVENFDDPSERASVRMPAGSFEPDKPEWHGWFNTVEAAMMSELNKSPTEEEVRVYSSSDGIWFEFYAQSGSGMVPVEPWFPQPENVVDFKRSYVPHGSGKSVTGWCVQTHIKG